MQVCYFWAMQPPVFEIFTSRQTSVLNKGLLGEKCDRYLFLEHIRLQPQFFFLVHWLYYNWQIFDNGDRKQERRGKSMHHFIPHSSEKSPAPSKNRFAAIQNQKSQVRPELRTQPAWTECHCSTDCATTAAQIVSTVQFYFWVSITKIAVTGLELKTSFFSSSHNSSLKELK